MAKTSQKIDAATLNAFARAGFAGETAFTTEVELIKAHAVKGKVPSAYALAYCAAVVCAKAGLKNTVANRKLVVDERATRKDDWAAARNRLSRRVKAAGVKAGNASGRKRGTKTTPPASTTHDGPTLAESAGNATMPKTATPAVPTLVNAAEVLAYLESKVAQMRAAQKKNAKHFTLKQVAALDAFAEAIKAE